MINRILKIFGFSKQRKKRSYNKRAGKNDKLNAIFDSMQVGQKRGMHIAKKRATNAAFRYGKLNNKRITVSCKDGKVTFIRKW